MIILHFIFSVELFDYTEDKMQYCFHKIMNIIIKSYFGRNLTSKIIIKTFNINV